MPRLAFARDDHEAGHLTLVRRLAATRGPRWGGCTLVAVDGPSGSGKSTYAVGLAQATGGHVLHVDDMHQGWTMLAGSIHLVRQLLMDPVRLGEPAAYPTWDWERDLRGPDVPVAPRPLVVLEGVGAMVVAEDLASASIWVEAPEPVRYRRTMSRDGLMDGRWAQWAAQERAIYARNQTRARADIVIDTGPARLTP